MELSWDVHKLEQLVNGARRSEKSVGRKGHQPYQRQQQPCVGRYGLAVGWPYAEHGCNEDVLEGRDQEQGRVFKVLDLELVDVNGWRLVPILSTNIKEHKELKAGSQEDLAAQRGEHLL